jgi:MFS family permease
MLYALILVICAPLSAMISGYFSDKYGVDNSMANSFIIMAGNMFALPSLLGALLSPNFYASMAFLAINILSGEGWRSPSLAMISKSVKPG